jgi:hypothetical protein
LVPSVAFKKESIPLKDGKKSKATYRFFANPKSTKDKWAKYIISKPAIGLIIEEYIRSVYK